MRDCPRGPPGRAATPYRHETMTADNDTPETGHESTEIGREGFPLQDATDGEIAAALDQQSGEVLEAVEDVSRALRDDDVLLADEDVMALGDAANALSALSRTLACRVPLEGQARDARRPSDT